MKCSVCGREFDERGYQLLVPGRPGSFDTFECAVRARGLPWLGPSPRRDVDDIPPFERPLTSHAGRSALSFVVPDLARARTRAVLVGATALLVAVTTASAYVWLRDGDKTSIDTETSPGAAALTAAEALRSLADERSAEASRVAAEPRPASVATNRSERRARRPAGDGAVLVSLADGPAKSTRENEKDAGSVGDSPASPAPPSGRGSPPPSAPVLPPRPSKPPDPAPPTAPPAPPPGPVADGVTSPATRPGWGHGDKNHVHVGPPGAGATNVRAAQKRRVRRRPRRR